MQKTITNHAPGIRGFHTAKGLVYLKPGETRIVEMSEAQGRRAGRLGAFDKAEPQPRDEEMAALRDLLKSRDATIVDLQKAIDDRDAIIKERETVIASLADKANDKPAGGVTLPGVLAADLLAKVDDMHFKTFEAEARVLLGEATPSKKDEIIAALKALV